MSENYFLSNQIYRIHNFPNGIKFYGSFLGTMEHFEYDISDDIDFLCDNDEFHKNKDALFSIKNFGEYFNSDTRNYKTKLNISKKSKSLSISTIDNDIFEGIFNNLFNT